MTERHAEPAASKQTYECMRCGERLDGPNDTCSDPLCDTEPRSIDVPRE